jgi:hypothetical protein
MGTLLGWLMKWLGEGEMWQRWGKYFLLLLGLGSAGYVATQVVVPAFTHTVSGGSPQTIVGTVHYTVDPDNFEIAQATGQDYCPIDPDPYPVVLADGDGNALVPATMVPITYVYADGTTSGGDGSAPNADYSGGPVGPVGPVQPSDAATVRERGPAVDCYEDFSITGFPDKDIYEITAYGIPFFTITKEQLVAQNYNLGAVNPG